MSRALSTLNTMTEVPLSKTSNPQLLPGRRSINGCPPGVCSQCVCTLDGINAEHKFRVWVTIIGCMSLSLHYVTHSFYFYFKCYSHDSCDGSMYSLRYLINTDMYVIYPNKPIENPIT